MSKKQSVNISNPVHLRLKWRLLAVTNLKGGTDSLFFIYDDDHPGGAGRGPEDLAMLSLNREVLIRYDWDFDLDYRS